MDGLASAASPCPFSPWRYPAIFLGLLPTTVTILMVMCAADVLLLAAGLAVRDRHGVAGPNTEELYFRGHLLPRLERYGRWAPVINTALYGGVALSQIGWARHCRLIQVQAAANGSLLARRSLHLILAAEAKTLASE